MSKLIVDIKKAVENFALDVSFECANETLGILGASGCGKSMTLRSIAGIFTPDEGHIQLDDQVMFDSAHKVNLKPQQRHIGYLFQNYQLFPNMTTNENICAGMPKEYSKGEISSELKRYIDFFQLDGLEEKYPNKLSGGQQQRVALARMFASKPRALMLDEPFSALDAHLKASLYPGLLKALESFKGPKLYVSHDIEEAYMFCDKLIVLDKGTVTDFGETGQVIKEPKSLAALKLSGISNIAEFRSVDGKYAQSQNSEMKLPTNASLTEDTHYVGIANDKIKMYEAKPERVESYPYQVLYLSEGLNSVEFACEFLHDKKSSALNQFEEEDGHSFSIVHVRIDRNSNVYEQYKHIVAGDKIWIEFSVEDLIYVSK